jgi:deoxyribose-phosphate aldolase|tara:strand:- start:5108 stop:5950 length:843 start_codon:yes stop_codon:yes gene_type:complete
VFKNYNVQQDDLSNRCNKIIANGMVDINRQVVLKDILGLIDLTTLSGTDNTENVTLLSQKALSYRDDKLKIPNVAAVCVYPVFAKLVSSVLSGSNVKTACVAGAFPSGQSPLSIRIDEVRSAVDNGADEIDMVISRGKLLEGDYEYITKEVSSIKEACGEAHLKVILETGELKRIENIRKASELSIMAGADFIKTSTGKISPAATHEAFVIMLDTIKEVFMETGQMIGIKPAGGISEPQHAMNYYLLVKSILGENWLSKNFFRVGASRLADNIYNEILKD